LYAYVKMKKIVLLILFMFIDLLFSQKEVKDPFKKWKVYKDKVDKNVLANKYALKENKNKMCTSFHGIHIYSKKDTIILIKGVHGHPCGHGGMDFYYKNQELIMVRRYDKITEKDDYCKGSLSSSKDYYIGNGKLLNFKKLKDFDMNAEEFYVWLRERESIMLDEIKRKDKDSCFE
jgi:hypothetical protein